MSFERLRSDFQFAIFVLFCVVAILGIAPFAAYRFMQGAMVAGVVDTLIVTILALSFAYVWRGGSLERASLLVVLATAVGCVVIDGATGDAVVKLSATLLARRSVPVALSVICEATKLTVTAWLTVTVMGESPLTPVAPVVGLVEAIAGVTGATATGVVKLRSSMASPSSEPPTSVSRQRSTIVCPLNQVRPVTVAEIAERLAELLPSSVCAAVWPAALLTREVKSKAVAAVKVPATMSVPPIWYSRAILSVPPAVPLP